MTQIIAITKRKHRIEPDLLETVRQDINNGVSSVVIMETLTMDGYSAFAVEMAIEQACEERYFPLPQEATII